MEFKEIELKIADDAVASIANVQAVPALEEIIWNSLDGEAEHVSVEFKLNALSGLNRIVVKDDGHGMTHAFAEDVFANWGNSPKKKKRNSPNKKRPYHGKNGQGRYKAFALGGRVEWKTRATVAPGQIEELHILSSTEALKKLKVSAAVKSEGPSGTDVYIDNLKDKSDSLLHPSALDKLRIKFAPYLYAHPDASITIDGTELLPRDVLKSHREIKIQVPSTNDGPGVEGTLQILEWNKPTEPVLHYCNNNGMSLEEDTPKFKDSRLPYSAYLCSDRFQEIADGDKFSIMGMDEQLTKFIDSARGAIKDHFRSQLAQDVSGFVKQLKEQGVYPGPSHQKTALRTSSR